MGDLTKNHDWREFGYLYPPARLNAPKTASMLEKLRDALETTYHVECPIHIVQHCDANEETHKKGKGVDVAVPSLTARQVQEVAIKLQVQGIVRGVGIGRMITHVDWHRRRTFKLSPAAAVSDSRR